MYMDVLLAYGYEQTCDYGFTERNESTKQMDLNELKACGAI
jgi:hypothetical protein